MCCALAQYHVNSIPTTNNARPANVMLAARSNGQPKIKAIGASIARVAEIPEMIAASVWRFIVVGPYAY